MFSEIRCQKALRVVLVGALGTIAYLSAGQARAYKVYVNPSTQTANISPDGTYNEANSMQDVASRLMTKLTARGMGCRNSAWLSLSGACSDANSWGAEVFVALHTNAAGGSGWSTARGTCSFYYQSSGGSHNEHSVSLTTKCNNKVVEKFTALGRGYNRGVFADYTTMGYNFYVLANSNCPATLIEGLFHTNIDDTALLKTTAGKDAYAQGVFEGVCDWYGITYTNDTWNSTYNAQSYKTAMTPGEQAVCWVEYRNTGNTTWSNSGSNPVKVGTSGPTDRSSAFYTAGDWPSANRPTLMDSSSCAPNAVARFTFTMTAPQTTGSYQEHWRLVAENKAWFGADTVSFAINVALPRGTLSGKVSDVRTSVGMSGATVTLNTGVSITTDSSGNYTIANLVATNYTVTASKPGYMTQSSTATVPAGSTATCNIALVGAGPPITDVSVNEITASGCTVRWTTTAMTSSQVEYGTTTAYGSTSAVGSSRVLSHSVQLTGLQEATPYHLRACSVDGSGNLSLSQDVAFQTYKTFASPTDFVKAGWNLISLPAQPANPDPTSVLAGMDVANASLQYWRNGADEGYQRYGETWGWTGPMEVGSCYWFTESGEPRTLSFFGTQNTSDYQIDIPAHTDVPHWVMVGHPFEHATMGQHILFSSNPSHPTPMLWQDAYGAGIVESAAIGFDPTSSSYFSAGPYMFSPKRARWEPWYGYWLMIRTTEPVTITVPVSPAAP